MIIYGKSRFIAAPFNSESELEMAVQANAQYIFGPDSLYLPKSLIQTPDGFGTIPDGFVVDFASRTWIIVEAELGVHSVWSHIAPQVAKQMIAASQSTARQMLTELVINRIKVDADLRKRFEEQKIDPLDVRRVLSEIFGQRPLIGIPIDKVPRDLREWTETLKSEVRLWLVRKLVEFGNPQNVMYEVPEEYAPVIDTSPNSPKSGNKVYGVSVGDLMDARLVHEGEKLYMSYKPQGGENKLYEATVLEDGSLEVLGTKFSAPSYAALECLQDAGSNRETVNGWRSWKNTSGKFLYDLRAEFLDDVRRFDIDEQSSPIE